MKGAVVLGLVFALGWLVPVSPALAVATTIKVTDGSKAITGATISFQDAAGNEIGEKVETNRHGIVEVDLPKGAKVTVVVDQGNENVQKGILDLSKEDICQGPRCGVDVSVTGTTGGGLSVTGNSKLLTQTQAQALTPTGGKDTSGDGSTPEASATPAAAESSP